MPRFLYFIRAICWLLLSFGRAAWYFRKQGLTSLELPAGISLTHKEQRRFKHYFYGASYLAALMNCLRNRFSAPSETLLFAKLSGLSFCFDDLTDAFEDDEGAARLARSNPETFAALADKRGLALHLLHQIYRHLPGENAPGFEQYMHRVFRVETSRRQSREDPDMLKAVAAEKGGASVMLFRSLLLDQATPEEYGALFEFGYLIQFCDDIFDLWQDTQAGITTETTYYALRSDLSSLIARFEGQVGITYQAFRQIDRPNKQIQTSLHIIHVLVSITRVCLRHYQGLQKRFGHLPLDQRTKIVVDMELWPNRIQACIQLFRPFQ